MKFLDLFSGIGGFRLGLEMAGHECAGHCEIDKFANKSYIAMHKPKESEWYADDITRVRADELPAADRWCFGFPCQDISIAGRQAGFRGNRSSLFFAVTRLIKDLKEEDRPGILFIENVKNLLSINGGFDFAKILIELDEIGYDAEWQVLNSKDFGVPQNRERVFIIGHLRGRSSGQVFPIERKNENVIKQIGNISPTKTRANPNNGRVYSEKGVAPSLNCCSGGGQQPHILEPARIYTNCSKEFTRAPLQGLSRCLKASKHDAGAVIPVLTPNRINKRQNGRRFKTAGEPMFTITAQDRHGVLINYNNISNHIKCPEDISRTLNVGVKSSLTEKHNFDTIFDECRIRRLTPREYFRLQGFPDEYFDRAAEVNSDSQLYKQAGNSVTVNVIYEIAKRLKDTEDCQDV